MKCKAYIFFPLPTRAVLRKQKSRFIVWILWRRNICVCWYASYVSSVMGCFSSACGRVGCSRASQNSCQILAQALFLLFVFSWKKFQHSGSVFTKHCILFPFRTILIARHARQSWERRHSFSQFVQTNLYQVANLFEWKLWRSLQEMCNKYFFFFSCGTYLRGVLLGEQWRWMFLHL